MSGTSNSTIVALNWTEHVMLKMTGLGYPQGTLRIKAIYNMVDELLLAVMPTDSLQQVYAKKLQQYLKEFSDKFMIDIAKNATYHGYSTILEGCNNYLNVYDKYMSSDRTSSDYKSSDRIYDRASNGRIFSDRASSDDASIGHVLFRLYFESYCQMNCPDLISPQNLQEMKDGIDAEIRSQSTALLKEGVVGLLRNGRCTKEEVAEIVTRLLDDEIDTRLY